MCIRYLQLLNEKATKIDIPIMLIAGAGSGDDWVVTVKQLEEIYNDISSNKIMFR